MKRYSVLLSVIGMISLCNLFAQSKFTGTYTSCDSALLPLPHTFKVHITNSEKDTSRIISAYYGFPCEVLYQIEQKRQENETVWWQWNNYTLIEIFPKKTIYNGYSPN